MSPLDDFGSDVADALGTGPDVERAHAQRQRLIDEVGPSSKPRLWRAPLLVGGAVTVAVVLSLIWIRTVPITSSREASTSSSAPARDTWGLHTGMYLQAPDDRAMPVELHGGHGRLLLAPRARARVIEASNAGIHLALEDGGIEANLSADADLPYLIEAGPLRMVCQAARFQLRWNATQSEFEIDVISGNVDVTGGAFGDSGLRVASGTHVTVGADGVLAFRDKRSASAIDREGEKINEATPAETMVNADASEKTPRKNGNRPAKASAAPAEEVRPSWHNLAEVGEYAAALRAAEEAGFSELVERLGAPDLRRLADVARVARDGTRAREALLALRERFPDTRDGKLATFLLGRVATELEKNHKEAARWFVIYVRENPNGSLRQTADGRIIDELHKAGETAEAKAAARRYLQRYDAGPYFDLARTLAD